MLSKFNEDAWYSRFSPYGTYIAAVGRHTPPFANSDFSTLFALRVWHSSTACARSSSEAYVFANVSL